MAFFPSCRLLEAVDVHAILLYLQAEEQAAEVTERLSRAHEEVGTKDVSVRLQLQKESSAHRLHVARVREEVLAYMMRRTYLCSPSREAYLGGASTAPLFIFMRE